ncbi:MAG: hypothetical protein C0621_06535 [Desulfuromonas sp.]|nr:MAG: hypothetical protein C0621_06535 [Desulfuromonas sp.]
MFRHHQTSPERVINLTHLTSAQRQKKEGGPQMTLSARENPAFSAAGFVFLFWKGIQSLSTRYQPLG